MFSVGLAYFFWLISGCGVLGFHRFYLRKIPSGVLWMCTGGLAGIGAVYDFLTLGSQVREANYHAALHSGGIFGADAASGRTHDAWRTVHNGQTTIHNEKPRKENPERAILRIAKHADGIISPGVLALEANIPIEEAKKQLDALVGKGFAELRVRKTGSIVYTIPEFMDRHVPLEDL